MGSLSERIKLHLLVHGDMVDTFKENSLNLYDSLQKSTTDFKNVKVGDVNPGGFYFFQYLDDSNWMKYAPVFVADYKKFSNKIVVFAVNFNFIPLEIKGLIFDKYIKPNIQLKNDDLLYEDILKNIGNREYIRDKKLESILGEEKIEEEVKEVKKKKYFLW